MKHTIETELINTAAQISSLVDWLVLRHGTTASPSSPTMHIDLEGIKLSRHGSISIVTLLIDTGILARRVYLLDAHVLGAQAFNTAGVRGKTLKDVLQDEKVPKVFFDVRNDSDALFAHLGVALQGVEDVQLMKSATRKTTGSRKLVNGLAKTIEQNALLGSSDRASWKSAKEKGERLFKAEHGGSYEVFNQHPLLPEILTYCVGDVQYLPELRDMFWKAQTLQWRNLVLEESKNRVVLSQQLDYQPYGPNRTLAPWSEDQNRTLDQGNYVPPRDYFDQEFEPDDDGADDWMDEIYEGNDFEDWTRADWQKASALKGH